MKNSLEAIRFLESWTRWIIGIDTSAIAAIGALTIYKGPVPYQATLGGVLALFAVLFFLFSILIAGSLLLALPGIVQRLDLLHDNRDIFHLGTYEGSGTTVFSFAAAQHTTFLVGVIFLAAFLADLIGGGIMVLLFLLLLGLSYLILSRIYQIEIFGHFQVARELPSDAKC